MRSSIFLGLMAIARAIRPFELDSDIKYFYAIFLLVIFGMDIFDLVINANKKLKNDKH